MPVGSTCIFSEYTWVVLKVVDDRMLLMTQDIIDQRDYHDKKEDVTWCHSEIRAFLNGDFLSRFSDADKNRVLPTLNSNSDNPWYSTPGGCETVDKVFLLSLDEVVRLYFGDSGHLLDHPKPNQRYWFDRKDQNNSRRRAVFQGCSWWWWLRTPGRNNRVCVYIHGDGNVGIQGNGISKTSFNTLHPVTQSNKGGVRPAMWVRMCV